MAAKKIKKTSKSKTSPRKNKNLEVTNKNRQGLLTKNSRIKSLKTFVLQRRVVTLILLFIVLAVLVYIGKGLFVAAMVGGKPITRLSVVHELEKQGGKQALESLITKELINQQAKKNNISVSDADVQTEIDNIKKSVESQGSTLDAALAGQGQTIESLKENIKYQKTVEQLLKDQIGVTNEELQKYFEDNKQYYGKDAKYEDVKGDLTRQLTQQKLSSEFTKWMDKVKSESNIVYFVNF